MGLVEFSVPVATLLLNQKRTRGRLKNNTAALYDRQPSEAYSQKRITFQASSAVRKNNSYY